MSRSGHTPFPWKAVDRYDDDGNLIGVDIGNVKLDACAAHVEAKMDHGNMDERIIIDEDKANIRLILAIPKMLKIIKRLAKTRRLSDLSPVVFQAAELLRKLPKQDKP